MKRAFKFKAWNKRLQKMSAESVGIGVMYEFICEQFPPVCEWADIELLQFTGLLDKHGREIYDLDIIKIDDEYFDNNWTAIPRWRKAVVWWDADVPRFLVGNILEANVIFRRDFASRYYEVVGNAYENPELIQQVGIKDAAQA